MLAIQLYTFNVCLASPVSLQGHCRLGWVCQKRIFEDFGAVLPAGHALHVAEPTMKPEWKLSFPLSWYIDVRIWEYRVTVSTWLLCEYVSSCSAIFCVYICIFVSNGVVSHGLERDQLSTCVSDDNVAGWQIVYFRVSRVRVSFGIGVASWHNLWVCVCVMRWSWVVPLALLSFVNTCMVLFST